MVKVRKAHLIPIIGFAFIIFIGTILLKLPIANNTSISLKDALYVSISAATCTGFSKVVISDQFTFCGQFIIASLMEIGSFGFIAFVAYYWVKRRRRIKLSNIIMIDDKFSNDDSSVVREYILFLIHIMLKVQIIGITFLAIRFIPKFGLWQGIWNSIFQAIAAFANSGLDNLGSSSLLEYAEEFYTQVVIIYLMVAGSIGIFVLHDVEVNKIADYKKLKLETKIVLSYTIFLLIIPAVLIKLCDSNLSLTNAFFMTASSRSSGLSVVNVANLSIFSKYILTVLMFIGGSPSSTAGGIRVVAIAVILSTIIATLKGKKDTIIFWKKIPEEIIRKAFTEFAIFILVLIIAIMFFDYYTPDLDLLNCIFECISAITNTGLTITSPEQLNQASDIIVMVLMFVGRVGPLSLILTFVNDKDDKNLIDYPQENIIL